MYKQRWNCLLNWVAPILAPSITYHLDLSFSSDSYFRLWANTSTPSSFLSLSLSLSTCLCKRDTYRRRVQRAHIVLFPSRQTAGIVRQNHDSAIEPDQTDIMGICTSPPTAFCLLRIKQVRWPHSCSTIGLRFAAPPSVTGLIYTLDRTGVAFLSFRRHPKGKPDRSDKFYHFHSSRSPLSKDFDRICVNSPSPRIRQHGSIRIAWERKKKEN